MQLGWPAEKEFTDSPLHTLNRCSYTVVALKTEITQELVRELLDYNPKSGIFTWKKRKNSFFNKPIDCKAWNCRNAGKRAGGEKTESSGYRRRYIGIFGVLYYEHRIAWIWMTGCEPPEQIDHINRDATDNRWSNLRASNNPENHRNLSMSICNKSGITGVSWHKPAGKWRARVKVLGVERHLGLYEDIEMARSAVMDFYKENNFFPGHGKDLAYYHQQA